MYCLTFSCKKIRIKHKYKLHTAFALFLIIGSTLTIIGVIYQPLLLVPASVFLAGSLGMLASAYPLTMDIDEFYSAESS